MHIYYDFDQSYIRDEAVPDLERLLAMMNQNPSYIIEIGSHTDSRGSKRYNRGLSERRAKSVVRWLTKHGIDGSRLVARGYGETIHVNDCTDNVKCSETQHQFNRRTEFKVIGCSTCADGSVYSQPKTAPKVDKCNNCPF